MIISYFYFSAFLAGIYLLFIYKNRFKFGFVLPSTVFMLMWTIACISSIVVQKNKDLNEFSMSYDRVGIYMFFFIISSFLGFILARFFTVRRKGPVNINLLWAKYLSSKLQIFLYLSFLLGLLRIFIIVRTFGFESLYDYRQNVFLMSKLEQNGLWYYVSQISSYVYILANFAVVMVALKQAQTKFNIKETAIFFLLYSAQALSIGGRMFVLDFISCFFFTFFLVRGKNKKLMATQEFSVIFISIVFLIGIVMVLGVLRNNRDEKVSKEDYYTKLLYIQDGIIYTSVTFTLAHNNAYELDYGKNISSIDRENTSFQKFRDSPQMENYIPFVTGVIAPLYFDFGYIGSLIVWLIICFIFELISLRALNKNSIWGLLLVFLFMRFFYDTPLMIAGGRGLFRYLFVLGVLFLFRNKLKFDFVRANIDKFK